MFVFFLAVVIRLFDKHLVYNLLSAFEMLYSSAISVVMFTLLLSDAVPFFISLSIASSS